MNFCRKEFSNWLDVVLPLDALLLQDDPQSEALLPDHLLELKVVSDSSMVMNSGEVFGELGENGEEKRGTERLRG
jgi:hypothetical protein